MTKRELIAYIRDTAAQMFNTGTEMEYFGGLDSEMAAKGKEMIGASKIANEWADEIERKNRN